MNAEDLSDEELLQIAGLKGPTPKADNILTRAAGGIKEPFPYLNMLPGGKELNQGLVDAGNYEESQYPGSTESNRQQQFAKEMGGSILAGNAGGAAAEAIPGLAGKNIFQQMGRSAIGGATAAQPFHYDSGAQRLAGTALGTGIGVVSPPIGAVVGGAAKGLGWLGKNAGEIFNSGKNLRNVTDEIGALDKGIAAENAGTQRGMRVVDSAKDNMVGDIESAGDQAKSKMSQEFMTKRQGLKTQLASESRSAAEAAKEPVSKASIENSGIYKAKLDELNSGLKEPITKTEYYNKVIAPTLQEISQKGLPEGAASSRISQLAKEYGPKIAEETEGTDMLGLKNESAPETPETIDLNKIKNDKNSVYEAMTSGAQQGTQQHTARDVANDIFQRNHRAFVTQRVPEWGALNEEYGPVIEDQHFGHSTFMPGETNSNKGANVIQKAAMNPASDEARSIGRLEKGTEQFTGTGDLMGKTKDTASTIKTLQTEYRGNKAAMIKDIEDRINSLTKSFDVDSATIKRAGGEKAENMLTRQSQLQARKAELEHLKSIRTFIYGLVSGGGAVGTLMKGAQVATRH